jgi:hypothetical protein
MRPWSPKVLPSPKSSPWACVGRLLGEIDRLLGEMVGVLGGEIEWPSRCWGRCWPPSAAAFAGDPARG